MFADGLTNTSSKYVNINAYSYNPPAGDGSGLIESDLPQNDMTSNVILSYLEVKYDYFGTNTCGFNASSNYTAPTAAQIAAYNTAGPNVAFCWSHTGGPGADYELTDGSYWTITTSGLFTTAGYLGTTYDGRQAYKITGVMNGQRVYSFPQRQHLCRRHHRHRQRQLHRQRQQRQDRDRLVQHVRLRQQHRLHHVPGDRLVGRAAGGRPRCARGGRDRLYYWPG